MKDIDPNAIINHSDMHNDAYLMMSNRNSISYKPVFPDGYNYWSAVNNCGNITAFFSRERLLIRINSKRSCNLILQGDIIIDENVPSHIINEFRLCISISNEKCDEYIIKYIHSKPNHIVK